MRMLRQTGEEADLLGEGILIMQIVLPEKVSHIIRELKNAGYDAYAVGGCVRDAALGRIPNDWDITTSARPQQVKAVFGHTIDTGIQHGTVTVMLGREGFEVTTYRIDGEYEDARHPKNVEFTSDLRDDLKRRDFTINAMAYNEEVGLVDAFDGLEDLRQGVIRCVGDPVERFTEDALRMMRAVRFAAQLGFSIEENTRSAIVRLAPNLRKISAERIQAELMKLLLSPHPEEMRTLYDTGITDVVLPEFSRMMTCEQRNPYHRGTVGEHTIWSLQAVAPERVLRLAMLFHDVAKPLCRTEDAEKIHHFHGHPARGAEMTGKILRRLRFDNDTIRRVSALVRAHDDRPCPLTERNVRRAMIRNGAEAYPDLFCVKRADILAQSDYRKEEKLAYLEEYQNVYEQICRKKQCISLKELAVSGKDLIAAGMKPGKELGVVLKLMLEDVVEEPARNEKTVLLKRWQQGVYDHTCGSSGQKS